MNKQQSSLKNGLKWQQATSCEQSFFAANAKDETFFVIGLLFALFVCYASVYFPLEYQNWKLFSWMYSLSKIVSERSHEIKKNLLSKQQDVVAENNVTKQHQKRETIKANKMKIQRIPNRLKGNISFSAV